MTPPVIHFLVCHVGVESTACGNLSTKWMASTLPDHVTCKQCRKTVAFHRAASRRP